MLSWAVLQRNLRRVLEGMAEKLPVRRITVDGDVYLRRYYLLGRPPTDMPRRLARLPWLPYTVYLHEFLRSDRDRDLHNHPWEAWSTILVGSYLEEYHPSPDCTDVRSRVFGPGAVNHITPSHYHRVDLLDDTVWTLFVTAPKSGEWGFKLRDTGEWVHWRDYVVRARKEAT